MTADPIVYQDRPGRRVLDLRPCGVDCIPVLGLSNFRMIHPGTDYHIHPGCVEICLCLRGNLTFETGESAYPFLPGSLFVSTDREPHRMRHNPKGLMLYRILFAVPSSGKCILGLSVPETQWIVRALTHLPKRLFKATPKIKDAFETLFSVYDTEKLETIRSVKLKSAVLELLIAIIEAARLLPAKTPDLIADIMKRMREHPDREYAIEALAQETSLSPSALSETFKRAAGLPPHAYLLDCRVERAKRLLSATDRSIASIAQELRFYSAQHFAMTFKRITGHPPREFRTARRA